MIGKKLKELIKLQNIKQIKLANAIGISASRLSNYLADKREPDLDMLARMAKFLNVNMNYFADIEAVAYPMAQEVISTDDVNTVDIPVKRLNSKKRSKPDDLIRIDRKLINVDISGVITLEVTEDVVKPLILKGDYLTVCPVSKRAPRHGDLIFITGRNHRVYRVWVYKDEPFITDLDESNMQKLSDIKGSSIYVVLLFMRRVKND